MDDLIRVRSASFFLANLVVTLNWAVALICFDPLDEYVCWLYFGGCLGAPSSG